MDYYCCSLHGRCWNSQLMWYHLQLTRLASKPFQNQHLLFSHSHGKIIMLRCSNDQAHPPGYCNCLVTQRYPQSTKLLWNISSSSRWQRFCCYNQCSIVLVVTALGEGAVAPIRRPRGRTGPGGPPPQHAGGPRVPPACELPLREGVQGDPLPGGTPLPGEGTPPRGGARMHQKGVPILMGLQILESQRGSHVLTPFTKHRKRVSIPSKVPEKGCQERVPWYHLWVSRCRFLVFFEGCVTPITRVPGDLMAPWHPIERCRVAQWYPSSPNDGMNGTKFKYQYPPWRPLFGIWNPKKTKYWVKIPRKNRNMVSLWPQNLVAFLTGTQTPKKGIIFSLCAAAVVVGIL